jgi:hypothetical protein
VFAASQFQQGAVDRDIEKGAITYVRTINVDFQNVLAKSRNAVAIVSSFHMDTHGSIGLELLEQGC